MISFENYNEKFKKLDQYFETTENSLEECIKCNGIFKKINSDIYYSIIFFNGKYMLCSVYIANDEFREYYHETYIEKSLEEWLKIPNLYKVIDINNEENLFLENVCNKIFYSLDEILDYLLSEI
jgi:hypothetical protein